MQNAEDINSGTAYNSQSNELKIDDLSPIKKTKEKAFNITSPCNKEVIILYYSKYCVTI